MKIGFIGAGKVGKALGLYFIKHRRHVVGYYSRSSASAAEAARITGTAFFDSIKALAADCDLIFITTPDQALTDIDRQVSALVGDRFIRPNTVWLHASGAFPSDCLAGMKSEGCPVGSMHPLLSFGDPHISAQLLEETFFSIEGTLAALQTIKALLRETGGAYNEIACSQKPLYHAGACMISNYFVTLLDSGMRLMESAGIDRETLFQAARPLIDGTLENIRGKGLADALTGPIARGDVETVALHLQAIGANVPGEIEIYRALALKTVSMINHRFDRNQASAFQELLKGNDKNEP